MRASVIVVSAVVVAASSSILAAAGQTSGKAATLRSTKSFVPPRTPWGDPDFTPRSAYRGANAGRLTLVERFTRVAPDKISWTITIDDPTTWTRPWTFGMPLTILDSEQMEPYECHEGNYGLVNMLEIARAADKKTAGDPAGR